MSILDILKKKTIIKNEIIPANQIIENQNAFQRAQDELIATTFEKYIPQINDEILLAAKKLQQEVEIFITVPNEINQDIVTDRFCKYIREYFDKLGYIVSVSYFDWVTSTSEYRIHVRWKKCL